MIKDMMIQRYIQIHVQADSDTGQLVICLKCISETYFIGFIGYVDSIGKGIANELLRLFHCESAS